MAATSSNMRPMNEFKGLTNPQQFSPATHDREDYVSQGQSNQRRGEIPELPRNRNPIHHALAGLLHAASRLKTGVLFLSLIMEQVHVFSRVSSA